MRNVAAVFAIAVSGACAASVTPATAPAPLGTPVEVRGGLPPVPVVDGPLRISIAYPPANAALAASDSNFIFGSVGSGRATLTINGAPVEVAPNGAFLGFLPVPRDGVYRLQAGKDGITEQAQHTVRAPDGSTAPTAALRILSAGPAGALAVARGSMIRATLRGSSGARAFLVTPEGARYPLVESRGQAGDGAPGANFTTTPTGTGAGSGTSTYSGMVPIQSSWTAGDTAVAQPTLRQLAAAVAPATSARSAFFELISGSDTIRTPARLNITALDPSAPAVGVVRAPVGAGRAWRVRGRNDTDGPFHFFWPDGTRLQILGERAGFYHVRLAGNRSAYVPVSDMRVEPASTPIPAATVASVRFTAQPDYIDLRIPLQERLPFEVMENERRISIDVFGATSRVDFFQYGSLDPLIDRAQWSQPADSVYRVTVDLTRDVWGYDTFFDDTGALILRIRRPPTISAANPFAGLLIAVDPGHPPGGAIGPTGLTEAEANLGISLKLRDQLQAAGARVLMTRTDNTPVELGARPQMAADSNAHILISVHNNAFPDGVNPFRNNGTSAYYFHPQSVELAKLLQAELLRELGLRDIGIGRADLALVRATWMPAVLTETSFLMIPEQEAAMRDPQVHERVARAHVRALEAFLRSRIGS